jgi:hypothetical protein
MSNVTYLIPGDLVVNNTNTRNVITNKIIQLEKNGKVLFIFYDLKSQTLPNTITSNIFTNPAYIIYGNTIQFNTMQRPITNFPTTYRIITYDTKRNYGPSGEPYKTVSSSNSITSISDCNNTASCTGFHAVGGMSSSYRFYNFNLDNQVDEDGPDLGITYIKKVNNIGAYAVKIFAYITIPTSRQYRFFVNSSDKIKLFLNSFLILNSIETKNLTNTVFLSTGTYLVYIEKIALSNANDLNILVEFSNNNILNSVPLDTFNLQSYTPITNAINTRDTATINFCKPNTNLFLDKNVCSTSLQNNNLLNNSVNSFCFSPTLNIDSTTKKLTQNCRNIVTNNDTQFNTNLKNTLRNNYKSWANKIVTDNKINENQDPLLEYLQLINPSPDDFLFHSNISTTCENNLKNIEYDVTNPSSTNMSNSSDLCKKIYNRSYIGNQKIAVDNSIQNIKNNFCDPTQTIINLNDSRCITEYTTKNNLSNAISNYCFPNNVIKKVNNVYHPNCKRIHNLQNLNTDISNNLNTKYNNWTINTINNPNTNYSDEDMALNEFIKDRNPNPQTVFGEVNSIPKLAPTRLTTYCETQIGDKFQADSNQNNLCNSLYSSSKINTDTNIQSSINKIKTNYCTKVINDKPRYETDLQCIPEYSNLLKNTIENRCIQNGLFNDSDKWCTDLSNRNINNKVAPYSNMIKSRTNVLQKEINSIIVQDYKDGKILNDYNYNFAINHYSTIPKSDKKLSDELLNNKLFDYCENIEPNYPINPQSQCKGIYETYNMENDIITSRNKMRDQLCQKDENILSDDPDNLSNNIFNCKTTIFDTTNNLDKFAPAVNLYCTKNNNISSTECQTYYQDIENKILDSLNLKVNISSAFTNNDNSNDNSNDVIDYDNKIELSSFQNCLIDDSISYEEDNYDFLYLLLLLLLIIVIVYFVTSCFKYNKKINNPITK